MTAITLGCKGPNTSETPAAAPAAQPAGPAKIGGSDVVKLQRKASGDGSKPEFLTATILPGRGIDMGDGWETRRRREPGNDWCILQLGAPGIIERIEVDTAHFKGNYPDRFSIQAACVDGGTDHSIVTQSMFWPVLIGEQKLSMDAIHTFSDELAVLGKVSHVRFNIIPDGGVSRLRLWGKVAW